MYCIRSVALKLVIVAAFSTGIVVEQGCSRKTNSVRTETVTQSSSGYQQDARGSLAPPAGYETSHERVEETRTVESDNSSKCNGVLTCTVYAVGQVIAAPFRLLGGLVDAIF